jgi:hypothetical protein
MKRRGAVLNVKKSDGGRRNVRKREVSGVFSVKVATLFWLYWLIDYRGRTTPEDIQPTAPPPPALLQHGLFGIPLQDAVDITREMGMGINVPSVVYRCVEYLEHMDAAKEEGIYRLSGSNSAIRMLKDKFNAGQFILRSVLISRRRYGSG